MFIKQTIIIAFTVTLIACNGNDTNKTPTEKPAGKDSVVYIDDNRTGVWSEELKQEIAGYNAKIDASDANFHLWIKKANAFRSAGIYDSAITSYRTYLNAQPQDEQQWLNLANTYAEAGDSTTLKVSEIINKLFPDKSIRTDVSYIKGIYYNQTKQYAKAREWMDSTIVNNYNYYDAYMEKAYSFYDEKLYNDALKVLTQLTKINFKHADAWYWKGKCYEALHLPQQAIESYNESLKFNPQIIEAQEAVERLSKK